MTQAAANNLNNIKDILTGSLSTTFTAPDAGTFTKELISKINNSNMTSNSEYASKTFDGINDIQEKYKKAVDNTEPRKTTDEVSEDNSSRINPQKTANSDADNTVGKDEDNTEEIPLEQLFALAGQVIFKEIEPSSNEFDSSAEEISSLSENNTAEQTAIEEISADVIEEVVGNSDESFADADFGLDEDTLNALNIEEIQADAESNAGDGFRQQQSAEEYGIKVMLQHSTEVSNVNFDNLQTEVSQPKAVDYSPEKIIEQITKQLQGLNSGSKVNIVLNPESLGRVNLQLINTKEGLSAQFTVTTQEARELIMKGLDGLKSSLLGHGINVENITVKVNETEKEAYNPDWTEQEGSRGGNKEDGRPDRNEKEKGLFEKTILKTTEEQGKV